MLRGWGLTEGWLPLSHGAQHVCGEPGAKSLADDLILGQSFVRSRAATSLRSIESQPMIQAFVGRLHPRMGTRGTGLRKAPKSTALGLPGAHVSEKLPSPQRLDHQGHECPKNWQSPWWWWYKGHGGPGPWGEALSLWWPVGGVLKSGCTGVDGWPGVCLGLHVQTPKQADCQKHRKPQLG